MATDSAELTFVRCHSCRSLVPAVSTRCRMCGATLDAAASQGDSGTNTPDRSTREKGASEAPRTETRTPGRIRQRTMSQPDMEFAAAVQQIRNEPKDGAPVAALHSDAPGAAMKAAGNTAVDLAAEDPLSDYIAPSPVEPVKPAAKPAPIVAPTPGIPEAVKAAAPNGNGKYTAPVERAAQMKADVQEAKAPAARTPVTVTTGSAPIAPRATRPLQGMRRADAVQGRLFGWLVSYSDPDGRAIELREGKFFVTGNSLKESDLIINDRSISTPHSLLSVTTGGGFQVQDLMSERGVFTRRSSGGAYQKFDDVLRLDHGDWIRFGDVEFLVCLIAHVGQSE